ncbi:uncharacterized protein C16orf52 homolog A isoform X6 [Ceratitis capitata]|uniref:uncharacterized protein C16orf52 homolog A isoform X6 n=1 Tax=Ceratitis capitata TaxID=7213 RepID=UPI000A0FECA0|nr:uncharacterized protein C16orf52 homolog A isoform X6 [Ceratitis capitata]
MDKLTTISATLFLAADVFAIVSLAMPDWIVTEEAGLLYTRASAGVDVAQTRNKIHDLPRGSTYC